MTRWIWPRISRTFRLGWCFHQADSVAHFERLPPSLAVAYSQAHWLPRAELSRKVLGERLRGRQRIVPSPVSQLSKKLGHVLRAVPPDLTKVRSIRRIRALRLGKSIPQLACSTRCRCRCTALSRTCQIRSPGSREAYLRSAQLRRGEDKPQIPIISPSTATIAAGGQNAERIAENRPSTSEVTVPPIAISPARRALIRSVVDVRDDWAIRRRPWEVGQASGLPWRPAGQKPAPQNQQGSPPAADSMGPRPGLAPAGGHPFPAAGQTFARTSSSGSPPPAAPPHTLNSALRPRLLSPFLSLALLRPFPIHNRS